jgi:hypothetical protein
MSEPSNPGAPSPHDAPSPPAPGRTRIVLADVVRRRATTELAEQSPVGDALLRGLIRAQLGHALRLAAVVLLAVAGLPLLFALAPAVTHARPLGISLPWLLLGVAAFPFLYGMGALYVRLAERTEKEFVELVERP